MSAEASLARQSAGRETRRQSRLRRQDTRKVVSMSLVRGSPALACINPPPGSSRTDSVGCPAAVGRFARVASRISGGGNVRGDSRRASRPHRALPNPSLESRPSEAVRLARVSFSAIIAHPGKSACLSGPAQLER
jgi:hypothetical protein